MTLIEHPENKTNQAVFDRLLPRLRASCPHGDYVLIAQGGLEGAFASYAEVLEKGYAISETDVFL